LLLRGELVDPVVRRRVAAGLLRRGRAPGGPASELQAHGDPALRRIVQRVAPVGLARADLDLIGLHGHVRHRPVRVAAGEPIALRRRRAAPAPAARRRGGPPPPAPRRPPYCRRPGALRLRSRRPAWGRPSCPAPACRSGWPPGPAWSST